MGLFDGLKRTPGNRPGSGSGSVNNPLPGGNGSGQGVIPDGNLRPDISGAQREEAIGSGSTPDYSQGGDPGDPGYGAWLAEQAQIAAAAEAARRAEVARNEQLARDNAERIKREGDKKAAENQEARKSEAEASNMRPGQAEFLAQLDKLMAAGQTNPTEVTNAAEQMDPSWKDPYSIPATLQTVTDSQGNTKKVDTSTGEINELSDGTRFPTKFDENNNPIERVPMVEEQVPYDDDEMVAPSQDYYDWMEGDIPVDEDFYYYEEKFVDPDALYYDLADWGSPAQDEAASESKGDSKNEPAVPAGEQVPYGDEGIVDNYTAYPNHTYSKSQAQDEAQEEIEEYWRETADYIISAGRLIATIATELGIHQKTAAHWATAQKRRLSGEAPNLEGGDALRTAEKRIRELEIENSFLKKTVAFFAKEQG